MKDLEIGKMKTRLKELIDSEEINSMDAAKKEGFELGWMESVKAHKFWVVTRAFCYPPIAYTFAKDKKEAIYKVGAKYGTVHNATARELSEDEMEEMVIG
jgi:hypothetical protein